MISLRQQIRKNQTLPLAIAIAAFLFFASQLWHFSLTQMSVLDEGLYLYKGLLFASGKYSPFQDYGPWTNQMPFSFLIPGWVQLIFGAGLRTGRIFAFVLGLLTFIGIYLTSLRFSDRWVAALVMVLFSINPVTNKIYAVSTSQGLTTFLLTWFMFFILGADRKNWQLLIAGILAGLIVMVRINMIPLLPITLLYVWWQKGWRSVLWVFVGISVFFGGGHIAYWPNILKIWAKWLPLPILKSWFPPKTIPTWNPDNPLGFRIASFFLAFRFHFAALMGAILSWALLKPTDPSWKDRSKTFIFLSTLLVTFFFVHMWASLLNDYCVFCFPTYTAFYSVIGLVILAVTINYWSLSSGLLKKLIGIISVSVTLLGITYSAEDSYLTVLGEDFYRRILATKIFLFNNSQIWQVIANKFNLEQLKITKLFHTWLPVGLIFFSLVLLVAITMLIMGRGKITKALSYCVLFVYILGCIFSPTTLFSGYYTSYDCPTDVVSSYEKTGLELSAIIPNGTKLYWKGYSPVSLTYLPNVNIYPAQLHGGYSYRISSENDLLMKYGWWNEELSKQWLKEADYLIGGASVEEDLLTPDQSVSYQLIYRSDPLTCNPASALYLYRRK